MSRSLLRIAAAFAWLPLGAALVAAGSACDGPSRPTLDLGRGGLAKPPAELLIGKWAHEAPSSDLTARIEAAARSEDERAVARGQAAELALTTLVVSPSERAIVRDGVEIERQSFTVARSSGRTVVLELADRSRVEYRFEDEDRLLLVEAPLEYPLHRQE